MGLKLMFIHLLPVFSGGLKSDQNGIETHLQGGLISGDLLLKSDQNGIETIYLFVLEIFPETVKIRPKWD